MRPVFVYGTLRQGEQYHSLLAGSPCLFQRAWVEGSLFDTGLGYPAALLGGPGRIYGEVYAVTPDILALLDDLEDYTAGGADNEYERVEVTVQTDEGPCQALIYLYSPARAGSLASPIPEGDWRLYRRSQQGEG